MKKIGMITLLLFCAAAVGCGKTKETKTEEKKAEPLVIESMEKDNNTEAKEEKEHSEDEENIEQEKSTTEPTVEGDAEATAEPAANGHKIAIDPGHQAVGNQELEPVGPGAAQMKAKVASGTSGAATGVNEYELTLAVSRKLQQELEQRGYEVVMIRTVNEVDMSNAERAQMANNSGAEAFVRIHANGSESSSSQGALTMCMTPENPYNGNLYTASRQLSDLVLDGLCSTTGAVKNSVIETDTMSGINWCSIPVTIVEMGFMSNPEEDVRMQEETYQQQMAQGIAVGIDNFFSEIH